MPDCPNMVTYWTPGGRHYDVPCGTSAGGQKQFCHLCEEQYAREFPQGWRYYPGDVCPHGKYVGGCGADLMCGRCEDGQ